MRTLVVAILGGSQDVWPHLDSDCEIVGVPCNAVAWTGVLVLSLPTAYAVFLFARLTRVSRPYVRRALEKPLDVVQTAGGIIGGVVGRDDLCRVMMQDLFDPSTRRPHVVVGGVGAGKTALLVQLTQLLARRGAVPVPVRLRDAQSNLDFRGLARERFLAEAEGRLLSKAEGERTWRHLLSTPTGAPSDQEVIVQRL
jgi:hypothetical protein